MQKDKLNYSNIAKVKKNISPYILDTPLIKNIIQDKVYKDKEIFFKLEFLQHAGSFKTRGAFNNILKLNKEQKKRGVVTVSAGNHALAVAYAAKNLNINSTVIMFKSSNKFRVQSAKNYGSKVLIAKNPKHAFDLLSEIAIKERKNIIHPFEGFNTLQGSATLGFDICKSFKKLDNIILSVGGGGLIAGVGSIIKQKFPKCKVIGVEPEGANGMTKSLLAGKPLKDLKISTIADSLGPPFHLPITFSICQKIIDEIVTVSDNDMCKGMKFLSSKHKILVEPAAAACTSSLFSSLKNRFINQKTLIVICGTNIDLKSWLDLTSKI